MSSKLFSLVTRIAGASFGFLVLWGIVLSPWLESRGRQPGPLLAIVVAGILVIALTWIGASLQRAASGPRMTSFKLRYHMPEGGMPEGLGRYLSNLSQEVSPGQVVVTFLVHNGDLRLFLEVPEGAEQAVYDLLPQSQNLPGGECRRTSRPLISTLRALRMYALVLPRAAKAKTVAKDKPTSFLGQDLLETFLREAGDGEIRWHFASEGRGLITVGFQQPTAMQALRKVSATVRRIPPPAFSVPGRVNLPPWATQVLEGIRNLYWWLPIFTDWEAGLAQELWLPPSSEHKHLDSGEVHFPLPEEYVQAPPVLVLGHDDVRELPVGVSISQGFPGHLLVAGGGEVTSQLGLALVEEALRMGVGVLAVGDHFDGLSSLYNSLPPGKRALIQRMSPLTDPMPQIGLLVPQGGQPGRISDALHWLGLFLGAEGISATAHPGVVRLCKAIVAQGLQRNPRYDLYALVRALEQPEVTKSLLQQMDLAGEDWPEDVQLVLNEIEDLTDFQIRSYAKLAIRTLSILRQPWTGAATVGPYLNLGTVLSQGGGVFCSFPLRADPASLQLARYVLFSVVHAIATLEISRPVLLYLEDFPLYFPRAFPWQALQGKNCMVALSAASVPGRDLEVLRGMCPDRLYPLVMRTDTTSAPLLASFLGVSVEALSRLQGRNALFRHPWRDGMATCTFNVLEICPPRVEEVFDSLVEPVLEQPGPEEIGAGDMVVEGEVAGRPLHEKDLAAGGELDEFDEAVEIEDEDVSEWDDAGFVLDEEGMVVDLVGTADMDGALEPSEEEIVAPVGNEISTVQAALAFEDTVVPEELAVSPKVSVSLSGLPVRINLPWQTSLLEDGARLERVWALVEGGEVKSYEDLGLPSQLGQEGA